MLQVQGETLRARVGAVDLVEGEPSAIVGDTATALARMHTSKAGELHWRFTLVRRHGVWRIVDWVEST